MVVFGKTIAQLYFVFPAGVEPLHNAQALKQGYGAVNTGAVDSPDPFYQVVHAQRFLAKQGLKYP
jgi:hypothetical protein